MTRQHALDFHDGILFWIKGWAYLFRNRKLLWVALLPILISSGMAITMVWFLWTHLPSWVQTVIVWAGQTKGWIHEILYYPLLFSAALLALLSSVYVTYISQSLIAVPFYSFLADRTLGQLGKKPDDSRMWKEWVKHTFRMIRASILKFILLLVVGVILFVFSFLPVFNIFTLTCALMILALDCMDYSLEAFGMGFRRRVTYYRRNWAQWLGMALGLGLTLLLPGLTLLIIPGAVVGAAIIVKNESL
ncbi:MAG: EI24 domain-containing protein [Bdellovibrionales bacterium]